MQNILLVYVIVMGAILVVLMALLFQRGGESERRLAKVRVRIEDHQPGRIEPEKEPYDPLTGPALLIGGALIIIIILIGSMQ